MANFSAFMKHEDLPIALSSPPGNLFIMTNGAAINFRILTAPQYFDVHIYDHDSSDLIDGEEVYEDEPPTWFMCNGKKCHCCDMDKEISTLAIIAGSSNYHTDWISMIIPSALMQSINSFYPHNSLEQVDLSFHFSKNSGIQVLSNGLMLPDQSQKDIKRRIPQNWKDLVLKPFLSYEKAMVNYRAADRIVLPNGADGLCCAKCNEFFPYAEANQANGSLICFYCRSWS